MRRSSASEIRSASCDCCVCTAKHTDKDWHCYKKIACIPTASPPSYPDYRDHAVAGQRPPDIVVLALVPGFIGLYICLEGIALPIRYGLERRVHLHRLLGEKRTIPRHQVM